MKNILQKSLFLSYIHWRKFFRKGDFFTIGVLLFVFVFCLVGIYQTYEKNNYFLFAFLLSPVAHHFSRNDFALLEHFRHWRKIIFLEYFINILPVLLIFCIKQDILYAILCLFGVILLVFLPRKSIKIPYPFDVFDPFWVISFRKYKLALLYPTFVFLLIMGKRYENENLALFTFVLTAILGAIPYFEREFLAHLLVCKFKGRKYLERQFLCGVKNFSVLFLPLFALSWLLFSWKVAFLGLFSYLFLALALVSKYAFFQNPLRQSFVFVLMIAGYSFGLPLLCLPFLYYRAVKMLENVTN